MSAIEAASLRGTQPLPVSERCDRCGAVAKVRAVLSNGGELLFCGQHARAHEARLRQAAVTLESVGATRS
ncbi:DUF7455 domain-containing protein [Pseudonocardia acaciae]|uniref:DUF7455 domain-containing protein n=1 Tax=Pseudonocardia acaciae TaxID=551276 RepID=UPI00048ED9EE|nr:hypothetical protein [Pseudonocardia acaciae]